MAPNGSIDSVVDIAWHVVQTSAACFGFVYECGVQPGTVRRGRPLPGTISDALLLQEYFRTLGKLFIEVQPLERNIALPLAASAPNHGLKTWYVLMISQDLEIKGCVALVYAVSDAEEAERILRLTEIILAAFRRALRFDYPWSNVPRSLDNLRVLLKNEEIENVAVYRVREVESKVELEIWGSHCLRYLSHGFEAIEDRLLSQVRDCVARGKDSVTPPISDLKNDRGKAWWAIVIGSGPMRRAGFALAGFAAAADEQEALQKIEGIQALFRTKQE